MPIRQHSIRLCVSAVAHLELGAMFGLALVAVGTGAGLGVKLFHAIVGKGRCRCG